jgi:hypothetical protein
MLISACLEGAGVKTPVSAWLESVLSMTCDFTCLKICHVVVKKSVSAWLECVKVKMLALACLDRMSGNLHCPHRPFLLSWNVLWSKSSVSACLERAVVKKLA